MENELTITEPYIYIGLHMHSQTQEEINTFVRIFVQLVELSNTNEQLVFLFLNVFSS